MNLFKKDSPSTSALLRTYRDYKTEFSMLGIFVICFLIMNFLSPYFLTSKNLMNVMTQISTNALLSIGMSLVILTGGIDLSVGAVLAISGMVAGMVLKSTGNIVLGVICALAIGLLVGVINGYFVGFLNMPAFIVTLGMMQICRSLTYVISDGNTASNFPDDFAFLGKGKLFGTVPVYVVLILLLYVIFIFVMSKTKFGRFIYATGSNAEAARLSGINTKFHIMMTYIFSGLMSSIAALVMISRMMAVDPTYGKDAEMDAIAAVVIGGTSMMGGKGSLWGTVIGVLLVGFLRNALNLAGINPFWQGSAVGAVIIIAVLTEKLSSKKGRK
jgi:ribose transport system permease protein